MQCLGCGDVGPDVDSVVGWEEPYMDGSGVGDDDGYGDGEIVDGFIVGSFEGGSVGNKDVLTDDAEQFGFILIVSVISGVPDI